ncbi:MAG: hypothetical protein PHF86_10345 [Candidatus Nanoarchaeia archaeon]|nr:hypothetical protein [Candidatus Nanoarchaeia archaeon]
MKYLTYRNNKIISSNNKMVLYEPFPPNGNEVLFYTKFDLESSLYFKDLSSLQLDASALTTTTPYDSIALSTDIRIQNICSSSGCFNQFYNGTVPDASNSAKVVLLKDLSQLYFDNYIFSDVSNNLFLIYSAEQTDNNLDIILDKVEARIKKLKTWYSDPKNKSVYSHKVSDNIVIPSPNYYNKVIAYDISSNSIEEYATLSSGTSVGLSLFGTVLSNGQLIIFPYNSKYIIHIDSINKTANEYGDFSSFAAGRFMTSMNQSQILLTDGRVLGIPRTPTYFVLYNPIEFN